MDNDGDLDFLDTEDYENGLFAGSNFKYQEFEGTTQSQAPDLLTQSQLTQPIRNDLTQSEFPSQLDNDDSSSSSSVFRMQAIQNQCFYSV